ncbi:probable endochitinase [Betta splendens]|uniref:chitinase n=1 Tax=Betta splendens TaxID=158456 RepID=A0A6P7NV66_BETSP|nr:probable endochitinase [Betta splendens]
MILTAGICLIVTSLATITTASSGVVDGNYCARNSDGYYANPNDATCYYMCSCGGTFNRCCLTGYIFQESSSKCVPNPNTTPAPTATTTRSTTTPTTTTTTTRSTTSITTTSIPGFCQGMSDGYYGNPNNDTCYYMCSCGGTFNRCCLTGYIFQKSSSNCVPNPNPTPAPTTTTTTPTRTTTTTPTTTTKPTTTTQPTKTTTTTKPTALTTTTKSATTTSPPSVCLGKSDGYYADPNSPGCYYMCSCGVTFPKCCLTGYNYKASSSSCG